MEVDISTERNYIFWGSILYALSLAFSLITGIPAIILWYLGLKGLKEKTNISAPYEYYKKYLIVLGVTLLIVAALVVSIFAMGITSHHENSYQQFEESIPFDNTTTTYYYTDSGNNISTAGLAVLFVLFGSVVIAWILLTYYFGKTFSSLGDALGIKEFNTTATIWYILEYGMVVWVPLAFAIIGYIIIIILAVIFAVYLVIASSKIPYKIEMGNVQKESGSLDLPIY